MMAYKLITEGELKQAIRAIESDIDAYGRTDDMEAVLATLRAVMERQGPKLEGWKSWSDRDGTGLWPTRGEASLSCSHDYEPEPLYIFPEEPTT